LILLNVFFLGSSLLYSFGILHDNAAPKKSIELPVYLIILTIAEIIIELWGWALMFTKQADWWFERKKD
jgi:ABC-type transport system involved in Fe-S cluster assembly fused permease/ATPase subunit